MDRSVIYPILVSLERVRSEVSRNASSSSFALGAFFMEAMSKVNDLHEPLGQERVGPKSTASIEMAVTQSYLFGFTHNLAYTKRTSCRPSTTLSISNW